MHGARSECIVKVACTGFCQISLTKLYNIAFNTYTLCLCSGKPSWVLEANELWQALSLNLVNDHSWVLSKRNFIYEGREDTVYVNVWSYIIRPFFFLCRNQLCSNLNSYSLQVFFALLYRPFYCLLCWISQLVINPKKEEDQDNQESLILLVIVY